MSKPERAAAPAAGRELTLQPAETVRQPRQDIAGEPGAPGRPRGDVERIVRALSGLIGLSMMSRRQVESRLAAEGSGVDLTRLFGGKLEPKVRHVLDICRLIELDPLELFRLVLPEREQPSPLFGRICGLFNAGSRQRPIQRAGAQTIADEPELQLAVADFERAYDALLAAMDRPARARAEIPGSRQLAQALRRTAERQPDQRSSRA